MKKIITIAKDLVKQVRIYLDQFFTQKILKIQLQPGPDDDQTSFPWR